MHMIRKKIIALKTNTSNYNEEESRIEDYNVHFILENLRIFSKIRRRDLIKRKIKVNPKIPLKLLTLFSMNVQNQVTSNGNTLYS